MELKHDKLVTIQSDNVSEKEKIYELKIEELIEYTKNISRIKGFYNTLKRLLKTYFIYCQLCKTYKAVIVHHINRNKKDNLLNNLALICRECHIAIHSPGKWIYRKHVGRIRFGDIKIKIKCLK